MPCIELHSATIQQRQTVSRGRPEKISYKVLPLLLTLKTHNITTHTKMAAMCVSTHTHTHTTKHTYKNGCQCVCHVFRRTHTHMTNNTRTETNFPTR
ncbi:hypothetical protein BVRB_7g168390 [Beta vulgaris subsp. vulgaris]|nr:hypothetical protein BVRB_7g168390 [Beta vulgaris subsp. vulgaris]